RLGGLLELIREADDHLLAAEAGEVQPLERRLDAVPDGLALDGAEAQRHDLALAVHVQLEERGPRDLELDAAGVHRVFARREHLAHLLRAELLGELGVRLGALLLGGELDGAARVLDDADRPLRGWLRAEHLAGAAVEDAVTDGDEAGPLEAAALPRRP